VPKNTDLLRASDVAVRLGVTSNRVYQLIAARAIPAVRIGGAIRIPRAAWETWLKDRSDEALAAARTPAP
jgi:excisionase family DNA binding protein